MNAAILGGTFALVFVTVYLLLAWAVSRWMR